MDYEPAELSRERAVSSEPCSTRPNPFDENDQTSRKRQRVSRGGSRSRSVDTARASDISEPRPLQEATDMTTDPPSPPPTTPPPKAVEHLPTEPTSSRVTINLRAAKALDPIPSSPPPQTPCKIMSGAEETRNGLSMESESDALSTVPAVETPSSSPSAGGSPQIELVVEQDDPDYGDRSPPVAIIGEDDIFGDPVQSFPFVQEGESLVAAIKRLAHYVQYESIDEEKYFVRMRDWMESYLAFTCNHPDGWHESYVKHREFWLSFPNMIWALNHRSKHFGQFLHKNRDGRQALNDFVFQFARLSGRFMTMDVRTLSLRHKSEDDGEPDLASPPYLSAFGYLLRKYESTQIGLSHIGQNLERHYSWDWDEVVAMLINNFQSEGGSLPALTKLVQGQMSMISRNPKTIVENLLEPCRIAKEIVAAAASVMNDHISIHRTHTEVAQQQMVQAYGFFKLMSSILEVVIEKYFTFLTSDAAFYYVDSLALILRNTLSSENTATRDLLQRRHKERPGLSDEDWPIVIALEWKFTILKKLINSTQMQLRVVGVTKMYADLLDIYNTNKIPDPPSNPLLLFFADFILRHGLVDYLVGTGSHPEIIHESNNIVGFLIVTRTYKKAQTDKIWQTVMSSQDPRVVEAILRMLCRCMNLFDYDSLLYLCEKARSLHIEAFTAAAREFCERLHRELMSKAHHEGVQCINSPPYDLCVRLIRQSSIVTAECPAGYPDIQNFAAGRLGELLLHGPSANARNAIYLSCIEDITLRRPTALGSICVINALLRQNLSDLHDLTTEHGLTKLIIEDLQATILDDSLSSNNSVRNSPASRARRDLLLTIIIHEPGTISTDLGAQLWNLLVGNESRSPSNRNVSWQILNSAVKKSGPNNVFIASCFREYLPKLPPDCLTIGALDFSREAILAWLQEVRHSFDGEDRNFESPALEQLWRMILTAPPNTIDTPAINILVEVYLESQVIMSMPRAKARVVHLALVDRCLKELAAAASKIEASSVSVTDRDDGEMVLDPSEVDFSEQEKIFARSLAVLREFLKAYHLKPQFATPKSTKAQVATAQSSVEGEPLTLQYQSFDGGKHTEVKSLTLGKLNNAATLFASLEKATGFTNYKVYCCGKVFDPDEIEISKSLDDLNLNGLVLVRREDVEGGVSQGNKTSLEIEITKHFDELWGYLAMHEKVAQEIYYFLVKFPVYDRLLKDIWSETTLYSEIFPRGQPFKSLYAIYALRESVITQSSKGDLTDESLTRAIVLIIAAISDRDVIDQCPSEELRDCLALHFIDCFVSFLNLKENPLPTAVSPYLNDTLLRRLLELLNGAKPIRTPNSVYVTGQSFEAILDACTHNTQLWTLFKSHLSGTDLLRDLLLDDLRPHIRKSVMKQIMKKCAFSPSLAGVSATDFTVAFWPMLVALIPDAVKQPQTCEETFALSHQLFKKLAETSLNTLNLMDLVGQWSALLLSHTPNESIGHPDSVDPVAHGLANLLYWAASFAKVSTKPLSASNTGLDLLREHLFPALSTGEVLKPRIPLLNTVTRQLISETVCFLVKDDEQQYKEVLSSLAELVPYDAKFEEGPYAYYDLPFLHERSKAIRSHTGYVGLKNLSNTCYLNSLFTQLYMNVPFREFMLTANVADGGASQKLLAETQNLFSFMQNTLKRYVDPTTLAGSIRTYEEAPIDVSIQMDVDEFYNLLFDRWEGQILSSEAKKKFRSFYGGQLVQQVKSKECTHISERLEPFSAIQCDIKGKSCLQESLQAYVDGEVMEGDNKYKCSTCDRHVDAVKRACLKDIPDNLIFHLKRFDFNLRTLTRSKINDYFSFPTKIDMRPYKVEHLTDSSDASPEDWFELVGVLVHSGTAESGHYYSFIRERPSNSEKETWIEFNDDCVQPWDPVYLEGNCFGGIDYRGNLDGTMQYDKPYSAYMLFYQRSSVLALQKQTMETKGVHSPIRLEIPPQRFSHIALENELLMRKYCLYDRSHVNFVIKMLGNIRNINKGTCSQEHQLEKLALTTALNHLDQVVTRTKDLPDFSAFMLTLEQLCYSCPECSRDFLDWLCDCPEALRHALLRNPDQLVRSRIARLILSTLNKVRADASYAYGLGEEDGSDDGLEDDAAPPRVLQRVVAAISRLWDIFDRHLRAWPEYFGLLAGIASLGEHEGVLLLDMGFLRKTLEIISADQHLPMSAQYNRMLTIINKRVATRPVSFDSVIELMYQLLQLCDPAVDTLYEDEDRLEYSIHGGVVPLSTPERHFLMQHWTRGQVHILAQKLLHINQNPVTTRNILIMLLHWPETLDDYVYNAIIVGIRKGTSLVPSGPFLQAAVLYCEHSEGDRAIPNMVSHVARIAGEMDNTEGRDFLQFFKNVYHLQSNHLDVPKDEIEQLCLNKVPVWAPALLSYYDTLVRQETEEFLQDIVLRHSPTLDPALPEAEAAKAEMIILVAQKLGIACLEYLHETYIRLRQQAVRSNLVSIHTVIDNCAQFFDEKDKDTHTPTRTFFAMKLSVLTNLRKFIVEEIDEEVSDWDGSEEEYGSSDPMDSLADQVTDLDTDLPL